MAGSFLLEIFIVLEATNYVRGVIFDMHDRVFLQMRADCPIWELPGGGVDEGEMFSHSIVREVDEESAMKVKDAFFFGIYHRWAHKHDKMDYTVMYAYICNVANCDACKLTDESIQQNYFPTNALPKNTHPYFAKIIEGAVAFRATGRIQEHDVSTLPRVSTFVETMPLTDIYDLDIWRQNPVTLNLLARGELPACSHKRFFKDKLT